MSKNASSRKGKSNTIMAVSVVIGTVAGVMISRSDMVSSSAGNMLVFGLVGLAVIVGLLVFAAYVFITSAKKTPKASQGKDREAKKFIPVADKGIVYIFRDQFIGMAKAFPVILSGVPTGHVKGKTFLRIELPAGRYMLSGDKACKEETSFSVGNGQQLFIEQEMVAGMLKGGYAFHVLGDDAKIRARITNCRLLEIK